VQFALTAWRSLSNLDRSALDLAASVDGAGLTTVFHPNEDEVVQAV